MDARQRFGVYLYSQRSSIRPDSLSDVVEHFGTLNFTWRAEGQPIPKEFTKIMDRATFQDLVKSQGQTAETMLAKQIRISLHYIIDEHGAERIANAILDRISNALASTQPGEPAQYTHSELYNNWMKHLGGDAEV